jgi:predicted deacylase
VVHYFFFKKYYGQKLTTMIKSITAVSSLACIVAVCNALSSPINRVMVVGGTHGNEYTGTHSFIVVFFFFEDCGR